MCLAVPGMVQSLEGDDPLRRRGKVSFDGVVREINLAFLPDVRPGDYVLVHAGMAIGKVDAVEAGKIMEDIRLMESLEQEGP